MSWFDNAISSVGSAFESAANYVTSGEILEDAGAVVDTAVHTMAVVSDGIEEGIGTLGGVVVGGVGDLANGAVRLTGDGLSALGVDGAENWEIYEGGFGTGIQNVNTAITSGLDQAQSILIDAPANFLLEAAGSDYRLQYATPPMRNDFDRVLFATAKTGTEVVGGIALVAVTGGAAGAIGIGSATAAGITTSAFTGTGLAITSIAGAYSLGTNIHDQFEQSEATEQAIGSLLEAGFGQPGGAVEPSTDVHIVEPPVEPPSVDSLLDNAFARPAPIAAPTR